MKLHLNGPAAYFNRIKALQLLVPIEISYASAIESTQRLRTVAFGDGYEQTTPDGLNSQMLNISALCENRSQVVVAAVIGFLEGTGLYAVRSREEYFYYTPPAPYNARPLKFKVDGPLAIEFVTHGSSTVKFKMKQTFEP